VVFSVLLCPFSGFDAPLLGSKEDFFAFPGDDECGDADSVLPSDVLVNPYSGICLFFYFLVLCVPTPAENSGWASDRIIEIEHLVLGLLLLHLLCVQWQIGGSRATPRFLDSLKISF